MLDPHWGLNPIRISGIIQNVAASFDVSGYRMADRSNIREDLEESSDSIYQSTELVRSPFGLDEDSLTIDPRALNRHVTPEPSPEGRFYTPPVSQPLKPLKVYSANSRRAEGRFEASFNTSLTVRQRACFQCRMNRRSCKGEALRRACKRCTKLGISCFDE